jgi:type IV secretory pathway VirB4 component
MTKDKILLGYEVPTGQEVWIPCFHTLITGQSQYSGKTTTIKALASRAAELGYRVLIFDTKEQEADYTGFGGEVPIVVRDTLDSLELLHLLESVMHQKLGRYFSILSELITGGPNVGKKGKAESLKEVVDRAKFLENHSKNGFVQGAARTIWELLERLINQTAKIPKVTRLELNDGISRMVLNDLEIQSQQVVIATAFEDAIKVYKRKVIIVIDEAFKFVPQEYGSACTYNVLRVITQGAMSGLFVWLSTQFLAITDKAPMKACAVKILGTQDQKDEYKQTLDLIPGSKLKPKDVSDLKTGHFYLKMKGQPKGEQMVYVQPLGVSSEDAKLVAMERAAWEDVKPITIQAGETVVEHYTREVDNDSLTDHEYQELHERLLVLESTTPLGE